MKALSLFLISILFTTNSILAQDNQTETEVKPTVVEKFKSVVEDANNYQQYKVIEKTEINATIDLVEKAINDYEAKIADLEKNINTQNSEISSLKDEVSDLKAQLTELQNEKDEMRLFGLAFTKAKYNIIMWSIVAVLILLLLIFIYKYNRSMALTRQARENLKNLDEDYEEYKRVALEKQQKLGRQLQDEKNKVQKMNKGGQKKQ
ncbi:V-type ATP synthase subunit I domain-containing protein [Psychroflexus aestuariivivens]|uniref:hypothetical protein n=1 Tax=Psychroflexus aestuariivivens TaxID=1795040 RepID=UPI000FD76AFC|nr:hypothetical protein [Psychroflexus aestuariivivens]